MTGGMPVLGSGAARFGAPGAAQPKAGQADDGRAQQPGARALRVAILIRKWSVRGGNERVATELARALVARGHAVQVVCQKVDASAEGLVPSKMLHRLVGPSFDPTLAMLSFAARARRWVQRARARRAVDVVFGLNHSVDQDVYRLGGGTHAEFMRIKAQLDLRSGGFVLDRAALAMERARFAPGRYSTLIAPSERVQRELAEHYGVPQRRVRVLYNGVDLERFGQLEENAREEERARLGLTKARPAALFVGQDLARKGFSLAVRASAEAGFVLVYVGQAKRPPSLPEHVIWAGERRDIERCYAAVDVLILPSHYDPFGGAVLEAYASGLPVVATDRIGATELARGPLRGLLLSDPQDIQGLSARLKAAWAQREVLGPQARAVAAERGLERFGDEVEAILLEDVARRAAEG